MNFIVYDKQGLILRTGVCSDSDLAHQALEGEFVMEGEAHDVLHMVKGGKIIERPSETLPQPPTPTYKDLRRLSYPPLADLADALYWQSQGDDSKMKTYLAKVKAVKEKYPKQ